MRGAAQRLAVRRLGVLGAAIALPAMAAPGVSGFGANSPTTQVAAPTAPMAFETPGESFPGSAFYYLADTPDPVGWASDDAMQENGSADAPAELMRVSPGPVARSWRVGGAGIDRARAENCLTMAIYYEAASESDAGQRAVAQVVLNRVAHPAYPDTVCGVVFQGSERATGCQFTFTCDGSLSRQPSRMFWDRAARHARDALDGAVYAPVGLATHYHTIQVNPYWAPSLNPVGTIGAHRFYRWRGAAGEPAAFTDLYRGAEPLPARYGGRRTADDHSRMETAAYVPPTLPATGSSRSAIVPAQALATVASEPVPALAGSGAIRPEYAQSGQWLRQP